MRQPDQSLREATALIEAEQDEDALVIIQQLAEQTDDPALRHELDEVVASGRASSRAFRRAWDRLLMAYTVGR